MSPATVLDVRLNEDTHKATVVVPNDQLSLAIGKRGQNVRLAVKLTHWDLDVISADESRVPGAKEGSAVEKTEDTSVAEENLASDDVVEEIVEEKPKKKKEEIVDGE